MLITPDSWEYFPYMRISFPRFHNHEYTALTLTDYIGIFQLLLDGYHELPSPGELSKLAIAPIAELLINQGIPELKVKFINEGGALLLFPPHTVYQCRVLPLDQSLTLTSYSINNSIVQLALYVPNLKSYCYLQIDWERAAFSPYNLSAELQLFFDAYLNKEKALRYSEKHRFLTNHKGDFLLAVEPTRA